MFYPECLTAMDVFPLFGNQLQGDPYSVSFATGTSLQQHVNITDQRTLQAYLENRYGKGSWGISGYGEFREPLLRHLPQMRRNKRYIHAGLDIIVPLGYTLYAPIDAIVHACGYEPGDGNYGGYVLLRHGGDFETFFSFYGHLDTGNLPRQDCILHRGDAFACIGDFHCNGNWFHHTHLQILTQRAVAEERMLQGYVTPCDLPNMDALFPSPLPFFRARQSEPTLRPAMQAPALGR
jgi:hypothetical protein